MDNNESSCTNAEDYSPQPHVLKKPYHSPQLIHIVTDIESGVNGLNENTSGNNDGAVS